MRSCSFVALLVVLVSAVLSIQSEAAVSCLNPSGVPVDFFVAIKFPKISDSSNTNVANGVAYAYLDNQSTQWTVYSNQSIEDSNNNPFANILEYIYNGDSTIAYAQYNDEPPSGSSSETYGHSKGVVVLDQDTGFWFLHSVPKWPFEQSDGYGYGSGQCVYGQSFMCISLNSDQFDDVGTQLQWIRPHMYDSNIPDWLSSVAPNLADAINGNHESSAGSHVVKLTSAADTIFVSFAKNGAWGQNLYEDLVAPSLNDALCTETWQNGAGGKMPSFCPPDYSYAVQNIQQLSFDGLSGGSGVTWAESKDHSKWAIATNSTYYVCVGGINRQLSQQKRGGGTVCFSNPSLWSVVNNIVTEVDSC